MVRLPEPDDDLEDASIFVQMAREAVSDMYRQHIDGLLRSMRDLGCDHQEAVVIVSLAIFTSALSMTAGAAGFSFEDAGIYCQRVMEQVHAIVKRELEKFLSTNPKPGE